MKYRYAQEQLRSLLKQNSRDQLPGACSNPCGTKLQQRIHNHSSILQAATGHLLPDRSLEGVLSGSLSERCYWVHMKLCDLP